MISNKKTLIGIGLLILFISCQKIGESNRNNQISIESIAGVYKGGTLTWEKSSAPFNGSDPNFTVSVTYLGNQKAKITFNTNAPLLSKIFEVSLTSKGEDPSAPSHFYAFAVSESNGNPFSTNYSQKTQNFNFIIYKDKSLPFSSDTFNTNSDFMSLNGTAYITEKFNGSGVK